MRKAWLAGVMVAVGWVPAASAQNLPFEGKLYVDASFVYQASSQTVGQRGTFLLYGEEGQFETSQRVDGGPMWDVGFGYAVWRDLTVGLSVSQFSSDDNMQVTGSAPHPLFYNTPRAFATDVPSSHATRTVAFVAGWTFPPIGAAEKMSLRVMLGPAHLSVEQGLATGVTITEVGPPYTSVNADVDVAETSESGWGVLGGVDATYFVTNTVGVGLVVRYAGGSVSYVDPLGGQKLTVDAGGFQVGLGARFRF